MTQGVILYNKGGKMVVRVAVALHTLRKHWPGPVTLILEGETAHEGCVPWAKRYDVEVREAEFKTPQRKNATYLNKCLLHEVTPHDVSLLLDADTITRGDVQPILDAAERSEFSLARFATWEVKGKIRKRVEQWRGILPDAWLEGAPAYPAAINTGVYGFRRDSEFMREWWGLAVKGQHLFIPDETCCQAVIHRYPHELLDAKFNCSCRYGTPRDPDTRVIHFHGRKHCRFKPGTQEFLFNSDLWYAEFEEVRHLIGPMWIHADRMLRKNLPIWDKVKGAL